MQKWEYLFVVANWENDNWRIRYINGKEVANWKNGNTIYDYSNKIGDEGWELVVAPYALTATLDLSAIDGYKLNSGSYPRLIFKRPK